MKNTLSDLYEQVLINEAEKHSLQNPSQDEVGNLKTKQELFGAKPKPVEGPDKAKVKEGPKYDETIGSTSKPATTKTTMPNSAPAKEPKAEKPNEVSGEDSEPKKEDEEEDHDKKKSAKLNKENFSFGSFEALFKKTLTEEMGEDSSMADDTGSHALTTDETSNEEGMEDELNLEETEEEEEEEGDLISDLKELQDKLSSILAKLEDVENEDEMEDSEEYSEEEFDDEFAPDDEEAPVKESVEKPKALGDNKGKALMSKKNKIGNLNPKGGKAHTGDVSDDPEPKALGDKKNTLLKGKPEVKSSVKKGDFLK